MSLFRLLLRGIVQLNFLTPKSGLIPALPRDRLYVEFILGSNFFALLCHLLFSLPEAGENSRGYLHGSMTIDFVGQEAPISRIRLLGLDFLVLFLQLVMMAVHVQNVDLKSLIAGRSNESTTASTEPPSATAQDHDSEERGVIREEPTMSGAIPLQTLEASGRLQRDVTDTTVVDGDDDEERLLGVSFSEDLPTSPLLTDSPLDVFHSGEYVASEIHLITTIRTQWRNYRNSIGSVSSASESTGRTMASALTSGRLGLRVRVGNTTVVA
jgi:Fungal domain of unknown function (DUF1746)